MFEQAFARRGQLNSAPPALEQADPEGFFQTLDPRAGRRQRQMDTIGAASDAAAVGHRDKQFQVNQVEAHGDPRCHLPSSWPMAHSTRHRLC
jgi:hypothetical protein